MTYKSKDKKLKCGEMSKTRKGRLGMAKGGMPRGDPNLPYCDTEKAPVPGMTAGGAVRGLNK